MAKVGVRIKLNVKQIEKARLFQGSKGTYLDCKAFIDLDQRGQYGDNGMVTQDVSKEERDQGVKGNILGNVTVFYRDDQGGQQNGHQDQPMHKNGNGNGQYYGPQPDDFDDSSIPF